MAVVWWEVETPLVDEFQRFHAAMWGWSFRPGFQGTELDRDYWIIAAADSSTVGGLQRSLSSSPLRAGTRFYLEVDDLEATLAQAVASGAAIERSRIALGGDDRWFAIITDPAGVSIGLWTTSPAT